MSILDDAGVVGVQGPLGDDGTVNVSGAEVLVLGGQTKEFDPEPLLRPMLESLAAAGDPAALAADATLKDPPGNGEKVHALVTSVRGDHRLHDRVTTVDSLGDFAGLAAMVLGLADLARGDVGDYGTGEGADSLLPSRQP
ncbi:MAG TPA: copper transporter [Acidimicrobiales bacterium]